MNILFLALDVNITSTSGEAVHTFELARSLKRLTHQVSLILPEVPSCRESLVNWGMSESDVHFCPGYTTLRIIDYVSGIARRDQIDVIYERRFSPKVGTAVKMLTSRPLVVEINGLPLTEAAMRNGSLVQETPMSVIKSKLRDSMFKMADSIVLVSEGLRNAFLDCSDVGEDRVHVVRNGANTDLFIPKNSSRMKEKLGLESGHYMCYSGSLQPWHNIPLLFHALSAIRPSLDDWKLLIVGAGKARPSLESLSCQLGIEDSLKFVGYVSYFDVNEYINAADFCVHISRPLGYTLSPLKFYEYLSCGRPVLADDLVEVDEDTQECTANVKHGDAEELSHALLELIGNEDIRREMGKKAREVAVKKYSWTHTATRISEICEQVSRHG